MVTRWSEILDPQGELRCSVGCLHPIGKDGRIWKVPDDRTSQILGVWYEFGGLRKDWDKFVPHEATDNETESFFIFIFFYFTT